MKKDFKEDIVIPEGVIVDVEDKTIKIKYGENKIVKTFVTPKLNFAKKDNKILIEAKNGTKREKKMMGTVTAHIKNMIKGLTEGFEYKLKICSSHFPMSVIVEKDDIIIKNFLGEKISRKAKILAGVDVKIEGDEIIVTGHNIESVGQTAANIENSCRITGRDKRRFQDGCYMTVKAGKVL